MLVGWISHTKMNFLLGARNDTAKQMAEVLRFSEVSLEKLHSTFSELQQNLTSVNTCTLNIANKLYPREGYTILQDFIDANR